MIDLRPRDNKKTALRAIMRNSNTSKVIRDAMNAPVGSTSRLRAQKILSVVKRASRQDGAGGPGISMSQMPYTPKTPDYSNLIIFPSIPPIRVPIGKQPPQMDMPSLDGAGGPNTSGFGIPAVGGIVGPLSLSSQYANQLGNFRMPESLTSPQAGETNLEMYANVAPRAIMSGLQTGVNTLGAVGQTVNKGVGALGNFASSIGRYLGAPVGTSYAQANPQQQAPAAPGAPGAPGAPAAPGQAQPGGIPWGALQMNNNLADTLSSQAANAAPMQQQGAPGAQQGTTGGTQQGAYGEQPSSLYPGIADAVRSGMGPSMFSYQALARGPEYLKTLPGFEGLPDSALQGAPTLSGRIGDLDAALRQSYHLDTILNQYTDLVKAGVGLEGRLTDYIRGRDQFLNQTNDMLESYKDKMLTMNLADPEIRNSAQTYGNYLYELRGRQNKRYIEFLNTSVGEYNQKLGSLGTMYQTALDGYQRELTTKSAITQEEYNIMFGALTDMYNGVADAPMKALEVQKLQSEIYAAQMSAAKDAADMYQNNNGKAYAAAWKQLQDVGAIVDNKWVPNSYSNLAVDEPTYFLAAMSDAGRAAMTQPDKDGNLPSVDSILGVANNMTSYLGQMAQSGAFDNQEQLNGILNNVRSQASKAIVSNGYLSPSQAPTIKSAISYLSNQDLSWMPFSKGTPSREKFVSTFEKQGLDRRFLDALFTDYEQYGDRTAFGQAKTVDTNGQPYSDGALLMNVANSYIDKSSR